MKCCATLVCVAAALPLFAAVEAEKDIAYAAPERCKLDVKWPKGTTNFPTVVWFHGGGLSSGYYFEHEFDPSVLAKKPANSSSRWLPC